MNDDGRNALKPGYMAWATLVTFLDTVRTEGVPSHIDSSVLPNMSGTAKSQLRLTLQFLGLVDQNSATSSELAKLANADLDERKVILNRILKQSYGFLFDASNGFDLTNATAKAFSEKFDQYGLNGETKIKAEAFFLNAAKFANIDVSKHITNNRNTRKRRERAKPKAVSPSTPKTSNASEKSQETPAPLGNISASGQGQEFLNGKYGLLHKLQIEYLPQNGQWTRQERDDYLDAYNALLKMLVKVTDSVDEDDMEDEEEYYE